MSGHPERRFDLLKSALDNPFTWSFNSPIFFSRTYPLSLSFSFPCLFIRCFCCQHLLYVFYCYSFSITSPFIWSILFLRTTRIEYFVWPSSSNICWQPIILSYLKLYKYFLSKWQASFYLTLAVFMGPGPTRGTNKTSKVAIRLKIIKITGPN